MKIGYVGPIGSYSYEAVQKSKSENDEIIEYDSIFNIVQALEKDNIQSCIVPLENTIYGSVADTLDAILEYNDIYIIDEIVMSTNYIFMSKAKDSTIARIYSNLQAFEQCKKFLNDNYYDIEKIPVSSISYAAQLAAKESDTACICNMACKDLYNLEVLNSNIQDSKDNSTKFIVLSKRKNDRSTKKTSIIFTTKDEPGALYKVLGIFSLSEINLTKIESKPSKNNSEEYMFIVDIEGDEKEEKIAKTLDSIKNFCRDFRVLGSY